MPESSLLEIERRVQSIQANEKQPPPRIPIAGDELIAESRNISSRVDAEDGIAIRQFIKAKEAISDRGSKDSIFAKKFREGASGKKGEELLNFIQETGDQLQIDHLKKTDPTFTKQNAALVGVGDTVTFGQLSRITGAVESLFDDKSVSDSIVDKADFYRLLEKEYPGSNIAGQVAGFFTPGSPAKLVFEKVLSGGTKAALKTLPKVAKNRRLLNEARKFLARGASGTAAAGTHIGIEESLGTGDQDVDLERGVRNAVTGGLLGGAFFAGIPPAAAAARAVARGAKSAITPLARSARRGAESVFEQTTGVPREALTAAARRGPQIKEAAGEQASIADNFVNTMMDFVEKTKGNQLPELRAANDLLEYLPDVDPKPVISYLRSVKAGIDPRLDSTVKTLRDWATRIEQAIPKGKTKISAQKMNDFKKQFQRAADGEYGEVSDLYYSALKDAGHRARVSILRGARGEQTKEGKIYGELMSKVHGKIRALDKVQRFVGRTQDQMERRSEAFISNLFGKNKTVQVRRMRQLDEKFGTNFTEIAEDAFRAKQLGGATPPLLPAHRTGASLLGAGALGALGFAGGHATPGRGDDDLLTGAGLVGGLALSSPKFAVMALGSSDKIANVAKVLTAKPELLRRMKTNSKLPKIVRQLTADIEQTMIKDGPESATSTLRLIADTPVFIGIVSALDDATKAEELERQKRLNRALQRRGAR